MYNNDSPYNWQSLTRFSDTEGVGSLTFHVAGVASVSVRFRSKERPRKGIFGFDRARNETRAKKWKRGEGEGKEGNACRQTPRYWKPAFASERSARLARLVEQCWHVTMKGLFHTERSCMVCDTHVVVVVYSGRQDLLDLPSFFWNAKFFLRLNKGFWSFLLLSKVPPGSK